MSDQPEPLLTAAQIAQRIGLSPKSGPRVVRCWFHEGRIPAAIAEPNFLRFDWGEVREALAKRAQGAVTH
jgi:predicted site-specific integrase-resolvase